MAIFGTKKFWKPALGAGSTQKENQILKNQGYINIQLHAVNYMSVGDFWQRKFGGKENIALTTTVKYQKNSDNAVEATTVQDVREVRSNKNYNLGIQRNIAVKIPATANAISLEVKITAIKSDELQTKFDMLNNPDYQSALQLAPVIVGQVLTVTSLVKKLFTASTVSAQLEASYAGVISQQAEDNPVTAGRLTQGTLIVISTEDGEKFQNVDETKFEVRGDSLYYNKKLVENTYVLFNISFESLKGEDEESTWFKKYSEALSNLDKLRVTSDADEYPKIFTDSKNFWMAGNALLDDDQSYINTERVKIKNAAYAGLEAKYAELAKTVQPALNLSGYKDILKSLTGSTSFQTINAALPSTGSFISSNYEVDPYKSLGVSFFENLNPQKSNLGELLQADKVNYVDDLKKQNLTFKLGDF